MDHYFVVYARNLLRTDEDVFTMVCFENEAQGVYENIAFEQTDHKLTVVPVENKVMDLEIYFYKAPAVDLFKDWEARFEGLELFLQEKQNEDWMAKWKESFTSFELAPNLWVVPSWERDLAKLSKIDQKIFIDPGLAFGTGTHSSTKICVELMLKFIKTNQLGSVLDVGTGTGILSIIADQNKATRVTAIEIDPVAREVAQKNIEINQSSSVEVSNESINELKGEYDLVVANIIDGILVEIKQDLYRLCKKNGYLIVAGILLEREPVFSTNFVSSLKLEVMERVTLGEWVGFLLKKSKQ